MDWIPVPTPSEPNSGPQPDQEVGDRRYRGFHPWDLIIILDLAMLGMSFLATILMGPAASNPLEGASPILVEMLMWFNGIVSLTMMGGLPLLWLSVTRVGGWAGAMHFVGMSNPRFGRGAWIGFGCLLAIVLAAGAIAFGYLIEATGTDPGGDPLFEQIARDGSWALMFGIALTAGVGEEVLFRGVLQKWLRWWGQALVFGVAHINQGYWAVGFIVVLSGGLGYLRKRGVPLWSLMLAHFAYDLILLTILKLQVT